MKKNYIKKIEKEMNSFFLKLVPTGELFLRLGLGISFIIHGSDKFPLPPSKLIEYFGFHPYLASFRPSSVPSQGP